MPGQSAKLYSGLRLGLCCMFREEPIRFRTATATSLGRMNLEARRRKLSDICRSNADSLLEALKYCAANAIGSFRVISSILPAKTHPEVGYEVEELPDAVEIITKFRDCGTFAHEHDIRLVFHPDQFVVLSSPREEVVRKSIQDLEYHAEVAEWIGADIINVHGGGAYGDKEAALARFQANFKNLSEAIKSRLTVENDDKAYSPRDLLPLCRDLQIPLVYDVHHHRCLDDGLTVEESTDAAITTWNREPLFHISSPLEGWTGPRPERHHDFIDPSDFPDCWRALNITVEIEAKAKELAVNRLHETLRLTERTSVNRHAVNRRKRVRS